MGSAIALFAGAQALCVPRSRFVPVKKNSDLLVLMSDAYTLAPDFTLNLAAERAGVPPMVQLDDRYYLLYAEMHSRFSRGAPSLRRCTSLRVEGDVRFGYAVRVEGAVTLTRSRPDAHVGARWGSAAVTTQFYVNPLHL